MRADTLSDAIGMIGGDLVSAADQKRGKRRRRLGAAALAAAACLCLLAVGVLHQPGGTDSGGALALPEYPEMAAYPDETAYVNALTGEFDDEGFMEAYEAWWQDRRTQLDQPEGYADGLEDFSAAAMRQLLSGAGEENRVCSPLNLYIALGMLAETTGGNSRQQLLDALGAADVETLRAKVSALWNANYCRDGAVTSVLANALWLNQDVAFRQSTLDTLAESYYASAYQGGIEDMNRLLREWLNEQTDGLLQEQVDTVQLDSRTILSLTSAICFRAKWKNEFSASNTEQGTFHAPGGDVACEFMRQSLDQRYYWGENFSAISRGLEGSGLMWLILPDEGVQADSLLAEDSIMDLIFSGGDSADSKFLIVHQSVPKFDAVSDIDLVEALESLGITDVFDGERSDFTPLTDTEGVYVSQARHAARVMVDEEGCTAAAYTVMTAAGATAPPEEEVDFVLDRPFLFAITGDSGQLLFAGVVNQPA